MSSKSKFRRWVNEWLTFVNLRIGTRTTERAETDRLLNLKQAGRFRHQVFPANRSMRSNPLLGVLEEYSEETSRFARLRQDGMYSFSNDYFTSPDAEVAYAHIHLLHPKRRRGQLEPDREAHTNY